ncbi:hypothetical protein H0H87_000150 [Tephrocybe sp. NHM501043]|nr:hypothetical protein H0H87_000150 [Tephrocybe sp. NHM501043]
MTSSSSSSPEISGADSQDRFSYKHATHEEVLDDLSSRFILNLPDEELSSLERICFQVEQAHWFYEDFVREENPSFPALALKKFSEMLFQACPLLHQWSHDHELAYTTFMEYKTRVPVCGAIMLNDTWEKCVLVKGWKSSSGWGFPKGKINEVLEETGYNLAGQLNADNVIEISIREQKISLFIVPGVPEDYPFKTKTRKEISVRKFPKHHGNFSKWTSVEQKIEWFRLADLPTWKRNKTAAGSPLKAFINANKPRLRKTPKPKKAQVAVSRNAQAHPTKKAVNLDSGSQTSSAENGEPHTPSPHYSEPSLTAVPYIADANSNAIATMDPHFANLLTGLAISASTAKRIPTSKALISGKSLDDGPFASDTTEDRYAATDDSQETSSNSPTRRSFLGPSPPDQIQPLVRSPPIPISLGSPSSTSTASLHDAKPTVPHPKTIATSSQILSAAYSTPDSNLSKQHIALLDAVSKESAKLQEAYRTAAANGVSINVNDIFKHPVLAVSALPPAVDAFTSDGSVPSSMMQRATNHTIYSSPSPMGLQSASGSRTLGFGPMYTPPPQGRPRTSFSLNRGHLNPALTGSASLNQSQLLALINGSFSTPPVAHNGHSHLPPDPNPYVPSLYTPNPEQRLPLRAQQFVIPPAIPLPSLPTTTSQFPVQTLPTASNPLLSILNSGRSTSRFSQFPPSSFTPSSGMNTFP